MQNNDGSQKISGDALKDLYKSFASEYPIVSIEDPFDQDDWEHYAKMTSEIGDKVQIVGDDLLVTNPKVRFGSFFGCERHKHHFNSLQNPFMNSFQVHLSGFISHREWRRQSRKRLAMPFFSRLTKLDLSRRVLRL